MPDPQPDDLIDLELLAAALAEAGRAVRDAVRSGEVGGVGHDGHHDDHRVVRTEGGDDVFGVDARAETALVTAFEALGDRWPGTAIVEGHADPGGRRARRAVALHRRPGRRHQGPAGRQAQRMGAAAPVARPVPRGPSRWVPTIEIPTRRAEQSGSPHPPLPAVGGPAHAVDDDLTGAGRPPMPVDLVPHGGDLARRFVTVVRLGTRLARPHRGWADRHLAGLEVYDDLAPCTGGYLVGLAAGNDAAVFDPRPLPRARPPGRPPLRHGVARGHPSRRSDRRGAAARSPRRAARLHDARWRGRATPTPRSPNVCGPLPGSLPDART